MKVKFSRCNSNSLANVPQVDGQLIYVKDTSEVYMDVGNTRNNITNFLKKDNTTAFTPTQDYHPSTKKYVDDSLVDYVKNTDYATSNKGGALKIGNGFNVNSSGVPSASIWDYNTYQNGTNTMFIGKGTLENVITGKQLVNQTDLSNALATFAPTSTNTTFDNTGTGLQATNVQDAIEELVQKINDLETTVGQVDAILDEITGEI